VKFVPHNTPAFPPTQNYNPISPRPAKLPTGGRNVKAIQAKHFNLFFSGASALTFHPPYAFGA